MLVVDTAVVVVVVVVLEGGSVEYWWSYGRIQGQKTGPVGSPGPLGTWVAGGGASEAQDCHTCIQGPVQGLASDFWDLGIAALEEVVQGRMWDFWALDIAALDEVVQGHMWDFWALDVAALEESAVPGCCYNALLVVFLGWCTWLQGASRGSDSDTHREGAWTVLGCHTWPSTCTNIVQTL